MKKIVYTVGDGNLLVVHPAPWARLCKAITFKGKTLRFDPQPFDLFVKVHQTDELNPLWAESEAEFLQRIVKQDVPKDAINVRVVDEIEIPQDRTFRMAWAHDDRGQIAVDMNKARDIHRDALRKMRAPKLAALDVEYQRADEAGNAAKKADVAARKQVLRDVTKHPGIDAAGTPDDLKAVLPSCLKD